MTPAIDGYHADKAQVASFEVDQENHHTKISYQKNGHIIPVTSDGEKILHAPAPSYITDSTDATKIIKNQPAPRLMNYVPTQSLVEVEDLAADTKLVYCPFEQVERLDEGPNAEDHVSVRGAKPEEDSNSNSNILFIPVNHEVGKAIVNFVDLGNNAYPIATSDVLVGDAGTKINNVYNTDAESKKLKTQGYQVVYNGFDGNDVAQYFEYDQKGIKIYTVALKQINTTEYDENLTLKSAGIEPANDRKSEVAVSEKRKADNRFTYIG